ncbi:MAG: hypothetical protein DMG10_14050 [Acidobacteria bacterium]|nr:MAG: hypothetical protein DMG10_14050 [Acidobacteriota bacterium]
MRIEKLNALQRRIDLIRNPKLKTASLLDCGLRIEKPNIFIDLIRNPQSAIPLDSPKRISFPGMRFPSLYVLIH